MSTQLQQVGISLSNDSGFSAASYFAGLMRSGVLKLFEMEDDRDKPIVSARAVLPDGQKYSFRILDDALIGMEEWRKDHKSLAEESMETILAAAKQEVRGHGKRRRPRDVCIMQSREGVEGIGFIWYEDSFDGALRWAKEQMASGLVRWMAILHEFNDGTYEITVFDSLMEKVPDIALKSQV